MCGIVGVIAKYKAGLFQKHIDLFEQILLVDQIRGTDGTGIIYDTKGGIDYAKAPYGAGAFIHQPVFKNSMETALREGHFLVGHNRAATKGNHTWGNTHPFSEGNITLVHNGTLYDHENLAKETAVDSHAICKHMAINGAEETLKVIDGAFALVWVDTDTQTLNLARNHLRPLHLVETDTCWVISSELGLGLWMADRHSQKVLSSFQLEVKKIYTFDINNMKEYTTKDVEYLIPKPVVVYPYITKYAGEDWWSGQGKYSMGEESSTPFQSRRQRHMNKKKEEQTKGNVIPITQHAKVTSPTRGYNTEILFQPDWLSSKDARSAIIHDKRLEKNFVLGRVFGEPKTQVRFYGKYDELEEVCRLEKVSGIISHTSIKNGTTIYTVKDVKAVNTFPSIVEARNEQELTKWCDKNGISNEPFTKIKCECCSIPTSRSTIKMLHGKPFCDTCHTAFSENPTMAQEMGYC